MIAKLRIERIILIILLLNLINSAAGAAVIKGTITDRQTKEPLPGAAVLVDGTTQGTVTDINGNYNLNLSEGTYSLTISYIGYTEVSITGLTLNKNTSLTLDIEMDPDSEALTEGTVTAIARKNNEIAIIQSQRNSAVIQSGVSSQQIARTQDRDASEVIRRVPGVSIIDEKFVMVRGLSQRYNNVWLNGSAVPSSEADSRAFSFDIIPSSQIDNMVIVKSPAPEYPADFTGGFIMINTKDMPSENGFDVSFGYGINDQTHLRKFLSSNAGSGWDWLGFGSGARSLDAGMKGSLNTLEGYDSRIDILNNRFNNDWTLKNRKPFGDLKFNVSYNHRWTTDHGRSLGLLAAANYNNSYKTYLDMENSLYGPYDTSNDKPVYLRKATDNQYSNIVRLGAMLNLTYEPRNDNNHYEWKNIFNQISQDRYSERTGINAQPDNINNMEYYYSSRLTYNTQITGKHTLGNNYIDWSAGYAYANRYLPDRRLIERNDRTDDTMGIYRISREFTELDEHIASANFNYRTDMHWGNISPTIKTGLYGEYRTRVYNARKFQYAWSPTNSLPSGFEFDEDVQSNVLIDENYGADKLYMQEVVNYMNNYEGRNTQIAGYLGLNIPVKKFSFYAGARYEYVEQELIMNTKQAEESKHSTFYKYKDLFPSVNITYKLNDKHQLRAAYGESVNRPEFRELSTSVYYDFDLGSDVMGNSSLKAAYIHNVDLRYEWYPSVGEQISVALFYKHFNHPIEWTYTMTGGTDPVYSYVNAEGADNYGIEVDIRKNLDFIGMKNFSISVNGSWIKSKVRFEEGSNNVDRPMQGQSPYLINAGLFYNNPDNGWSAAVLYNRIGKRIIGVGNRYGTSSEGDALNIPDSYEMPRNSIDLSAGKKLGHFELKLSIRDLLAEKYRFNQFEDVVIDGESTTIEETTRSYKPGRTFSITLGYSF